MSLFDFIGALFGSSSADREAGRLRQEAQGYRQKAGTQYDTLSQWGGQDRQLYTGNFTNLADAFSGATGLGVRLNNPYSSQRARDVPQRPSGPVNQEMMRAREQRQPGPRGQGGMHPYQPNQTPNYTLTPEQQAVSNGRADELNRARQAAIAAYRQRMGDRAPMGETYINEKYDAMLAQEKARFVEASRKEKADAAALMMNLVRAIGGQGAGYVGEAGSGYGNLGGQTASLAQAEQQRADAMVGDMLGLIGFALGGGFGGGGRSSGPGGGASAPAGMRDLSGVAGPVKVGPGGSGIVRNPASAPAGDGSADFVAEMVRRLRPGGF